MKGNCFLTVFSFEPAFYWTQFGVFLSFYRAKYRASQKKDFLVIQMLEDRLMDKIMTQFVAQKFNFSIVQGGHFSWLLVMRRFCDALQITLLKCLSPELLVIASMIDSSIIVCPPPCLPKESLSWNSWSCGDTLSCGCHNIAGPTHQVALFIITPAGSSYSQQGQFLHFH